MSMMRAWEIVGLAVVLGVLALRAAEVLGSADGLWPDRACIGASAK